jgi:hypothetical protein
MVLRLLRHRFDGERAVFLHHSSLRPSGRADRAWHSPRRVSEDRRWGSCTSTLAPGWGLMIATGIAPSRALSAAIVSIL